MHARKISPRRLRALCAEVHPDDGIDPRTRPRGGSRAKLRRHAQQLCRQVAETLEYVLAEQGEILRGLHVVAVEPAPDTSRLLVTVGALLHDRIDPAAALEQLERASGRLRSEVAAAITRRRAPALAFRFALPAVREPDEGTAD